MLLFRYLSITPYLYFLQTRRKFLYYRICFDVLLIINGLFIIYLCMKFSRYICTLHSKLFHVLFGYPVITSGAEGIRTPDPLLARQVLSQLSYTPITGFHWIFNLPNGLKWTRTTDLTLIRRAL